MHLPSYIVKYFLKRLEHPIIILQPPGVLEAQIFIYHHLQYTHRI